MGVLTLVAGLALGGGVVAGSFWAADGVVPAGPGLVEKMAVLGAERVTVPDDLVGRSVAEVDVRLAELGLVAEQELVEAPGMPRGAVMGVGLGGTEVPPGTAIDVQVSDGRSMPGKVLVPNVVGMGSTQAMEVLQAAALTPHIYLDTSDHGGAPGTVMRQDSAGTTVDEGSAVSLDVQPALRAY